MELFLNSVGALVAAVTVCLWLKFGQRTPEHRRLSLIGLVMLVAILFPVISVSDDLWSIQNPAETDTLQRRDHRDSGAHADLTLMTALPVEAGFQLPFESRRLDRSHWLRFPAIANPVLNSIDNRPPPIG